ncbi:MAG: hypothetical protein EBT03_08530 [Betaproteobacteria bacterium]|nr:hypothetical protein [Betaproteobacteria bacterium]
MQSYTDKINEIEGQKGSKVLDTARQLGYDRQALGIKQDTLAQTAADRAAARAIAQQNADANTYRATHPSKGGGGKAGGNSKGSGGATPAANREFWNKVDRALRLYRTPLNGKKVSASDSGAFNHVSDVVGNQVAAEVARSIYATNGLTPYATQRMHQAGYMANGRYRTVAAPKDFGQKLADAFGNPFGKIK